MHSTPPLGGPCRNVAIAFGTEKLEWCGLAIPYSEKKFDMFGGFDTIPAFDKQMDRHTVDFSSFSKFKRSVKRVDFTDFLRF